jgi:hypothetical protein
MMSIHTVAAGGGSICTFDGSRLRVGPQSAGANPGPASYRRGGPLTVTDCNVMVGKLDPSLFPNVFGPRGNEPLDAAVVRDKFAALAAQVTAGTGRTRGPAAAGSGVLVSLIGFSVFIAASIPCGDHVAGPPQRTLIVYIQFINAIDNLFGGAHSGFHRLPTHTGTTK